MSFFMQVVQVPLSFSRPWCVTTGRRHSCRDAEAVSHGPAIQQFREIPQLLFDKVIDVPGMRLVQVPQMQAAEETFVLPQLHSSLRNRCDPCGPHCR